MLKEKSQQSHFFSLFSDVSAPLIESFVFQTCHRVITMYNGSFWSTVHVLFIPVLPHSPLKVLEIHSMQGQRRGCVGVQTYNPRPPAGSFLYKIMLLRFIRLLPSDVCVSVAVSYTVVSIFSMISIIDLDGESREQSSWSQRLPGLEFPSVLSSSSSSSLSSSQDSR